eukprot:403341162
MSTTEQIQKFNLTQSIEYKKQKEASLPPLGKQNTVTFQERPPVPFTTKNSESNMNQFSKLKSQKTVISNSAKKFSRNSIFKPNAQNSNTNNSNQNQNLQYLATAKQNSLQTPIPKKVNLQKLYNASDNHSGSMILNSRRRDNTIQILEKSRKDESSKGTASVILNQTSEDNNEDYSSDENIDGVVENESIDHTSQQSRSHSTSSAMTSIKRRPFIDRFNKNNQIHANSESRKTTLIPGQDLRHQRRRNIAPVQQQNLQDYLNLKRIFDVDITDDKLDERRVVMLKSMLRMKDKENIVLRELLKRKESAFLRCSELCAFLSQVLCNEYIEKRKNNSKIESLGELLSKKDTRKIQKSLAWKEIIEEQGQNNVEKRILHEMSQLMSLPILSKSPEDIKILRKTVLTKLCEKDETFARQYLLSLMKEIKYLNKRDSYLKDIEKQINDANALIDSNIKTFQSPDMNQKFDRLDMLPNQTVTANVPNYLNYETVMRLESDLYILFRQLLKFLKNDNFLEYYQHLVTLKTSIRETLQSLFDFGMVLGGQERFAEEKEQLQYFNGIDRYLHKAETKGGIKKAKQEEKSIIIAIQRKVQLNPKKIEHILKKCNAQTKNIKVNEKIQQSLNLEYLSKKFNKLRVKQIQQELKIAGLESELSLQKNANILIEQRLNKIDDLSLKKFHQLQVQIKQKVFDQLRGLQERCASKNFLLDFHIIVGDIFKYERYLNGQDDYAQNLKKQHKLGFNQNNLSGISQNAINGQHKVKSQYEIINDKIVSQINKLKNYLVDFDQMMTDMCAEDSDQLINQENKNRKSQFNK